MFVFSHHTTQTEHNADPNAVRLDDEMAKVFGSSIVADGAAAAAERRDRFDFKQLSSEGQPPASSSSASTLGAALKANRSESDFGANGHNGNGIQRKPILSSALKRRDSADPGSGGGGGGLVSNRADKDDNEPLVSERARGDPHYDSDSQEDLRRVQFTTGSPVNGGGDVGGDEGNENDSGDEVQQLNQHEDHRKRKG